MTILGFVEPEEGPSPCPSVPSVGSRRSRPDMPGLHQPSSHESASAPVDSPKKLQLTADFSAVSVDEPAQPSRPSATPTPSVPSSRPILGRRRSLDNLRADHDAIIAAPSLASPCSKRISAGMPAALPSTGWFLLSLVGILEPWQNPREAMPRESEGCVMSSCITVSECQETSLCHYGCSLQYLFRTQAAGEGPTLARVHSQQCSVPSPIVFRFLVCDCRRVMYRFCRDKILRAFKDTLHQIQQLRDRQGALLQPASSFWGCSATAFNRHSQSPSTSEDFRCGRKWRYLSRASLGMQMLGMCALLAMIGTWHETLGRSEHECRGL